jgi:ATP adenylyltransferase
MDYLWTPWRYAYISQGETRPSRPGVPPALEGWPGDLGCVFCNLAAAADYAIAHGMAAADADRAARIALRGERCFLCLNAYPYTSGHVMVVPYEHHASLGTLAQATAQEMTTLAQRTVRALEQAYAPDGMNLGMNLGEAAGAGVAAHLHLHLLPRWVGDTNFMTATAETRVLPEMLDQTWSRLTAALGRPD